LHRSWRASAYAIDAVRSVFQLGKEPEQITTQVAAVMPLDPGSAHPIERLDMGSAGATACRRAVTAICYAMTRGDTVGRATRGISRAG
jgi:hypothetical protein